MTEEEEAALLAEYGVAGAFDELLRVPAPSQFRSDVTGDVLVFLTGAPDIPNESEEKVCSSSAELATRDELLLDPLHLLLMKYADALRPEAPSSLAAGLHSLRRTGGDFSGDRILSERGQRPRLGEYPDERTRDLAAQLEAARSTERRVANLVCAAHTRSTPAAMAEAENIEEVERRAAASGADDTEDVLRESERLLAAAADVIARPVHIDVNSDVEVQQRLAALESTTMRDTHDVLDVYLAEEDAAGAAEAEAVVQATDVLIRRHAMEKAANTLIVPRMNGGEAAAGESVHLMPSVEQAEKPSVPDDVQANSLVAHVADTTVAMEEEPPLLPLYAFEVGLTCEEVAALQGWDTLIAAVEKRQGDLATLGKRLSSAQAEADLSSPRPAEGAEQPATPLKVRETLAALDAHEAATLQAIEERYEGTEATRRRASTSRAPVRPAPGFLMMDTFKERVERLLPPTLVVPPTAPAASESLVERRPAPVLEQTSVGCTPCVDDGVVPAVTDVAAIQRAAHRQLCMVRREAAEARAMRDEDARVQRMLAEWESRLADATAALACAVAESDAARAGLTAEEAQCFDELVARERRHRDLTRRAAIIRETRATAALAARVTAEHEDAHRRVYAEETAAWLALVTAAEVDARAAEARATAREHESRERLRRQEQDRRCAFVRRKVALLESALRREDRYVDDALVTQSEEPYAAWPVEEPRAVRRWVRAHERRLREVLDVMEEEVARCARCAPGKARGWGALMPSGLQASSPTDASSSHPAGERHLDGPLLERLLPLTFAQSQTDAAHARQSLRNVSVALEGITGVRHDSLRTHSMVAGAGGARQLVAPLVHSLNLGGNALTSLSLPALLETFPALRELNLSDNGLADFPVGYGREAGVSSSPLLTHGSGFSVSRPGSASSAAARGVLAAQRSALAERCVLQHLDVSSNRLTSLSAVGEYLSSSLVTLTAFANSLTSLEPLGRCQRLRRVDASRNEITSTRDTLLLPLLQELNLCDNRLTALDDDVPRRNVLLTKLYLSNNPQLSRLPGGDHCFLFLSQLFLNGCGFDALTPEGVPWMPSLAVLHLEANRLMDISGLVKCRRLSVLNIAFNRLSTLACLAPLRLCQQLEVLDARQNPLFTLASGALTESATGPEATGAELMRMLPTLRELNGDAVNRAHTHTPPHQHRQKPDDAALSLAAGPRGPLTSVRDAVAFDALVEDERAARELVSVYGHRRAMAAEVVEQQLGDMDAVRGRAPADYELSVEERRRGYMADLRMLQASLRVFLSDGTTEAGGVTVATPGAALHNRHTASVRHAARLREWRERQARERIAEFLFGCHRVPRARAELRALRVARLQSDAYRREMAARRIQPVWRGAVLRARLSRVLAKDDEDEVEKVDLDELLSGVGVPAESVVDIVKRTVLASVPAMGVSGGGRDSSETRQPGPFFRFDVPATVVYPSSKTGAVAAVDTMSISMDSSPRSGSAPTDTTGFAPRGLGGGRVGAVTALAPRRPASGVDGRTARVGGGEHGPRSPGDSAPASAVDPSWGAAVGARIQQKNQKLHRAQQEYLRREFLVDPLQAKKRASAMKPSK